MKITFHCTWLCHKHIICNRERLKPNSNNFTKSSFKFVTNNTVAHLVAYRKTHFRLIKPCFANKKCKVFCEINFAFSVYIRKFFSFFESIFYS